MTPKVLELRVNRRDGSRPLTFHTNRLVCCGYVGRDRDAVQTHIDEMARLGVPPPTRVPIYMDLSPYLLTMDDEIEVVSSTTSGEVECVLLCDGITKWLTVGSDHTDRHIEAQSIVASKQMCGKYLAPECWPYQEVADHWDQLALRCWITKGNRRTLYQDSPLKSLLEPEELLGQMPDGFRDANGGLVLFSGTIAIKSDMIYGDGYELELHDSKLGRTIHAGYRVRILSQHL